jgi:hypothetical protein
MKSKEYTFEEGFTIKPRRYMGKTHVRESDVFDLYQDRKLIRTYDFFRDAVDAGMKIFSNKQTTIHT